MATDVIIAKNYLAKDELKSLERNVPLSANDIMKKLNIKSKTTLRNQYLHLAIKQRLVKLTNPDKPNSSKQTYYKE